MNGILFFVVSLLTITLSTQAQEGQVRSLLQSEWRHKTFSAATVIAGNIDGRLYFQETIGKRSFATRANPIGHDAIFDLASLSKIVTGVAVMELVEQGALKLSTTLGQIFGDLIPRQKKSITVEMLLRHRSGLAPIAVRLQKKHTTKTEELIGHLMTYPLTHQIGTTFVYSDINYMVLAQIVAVKRERTFYDYLEQELFPRLGMQSAYTHQVPKYLNSRRVVSQLRPDTLVNDPRAMLMEKGAGHAGVFSTARDVLSLIKYVLNHRKEMVMAGPLGLRGLGVDIASRFNRVVKGQCFSAYAIGHTGYTGTSVVAEPATGDFLVLLTNRRISRSGEAGRRLSRLRSSLANEVCRMR